MDRKEQRRKVQEAVEAAKSGDRRTSRFGRRLKVRTR